MAKSAKNGLFLPIMSAGKNISFPMDTTDLKNKPEEYWKEKLTSQQYHVLREGETENPFTGKFYKQFEDGMYHCGACGQVLFSSDTKFDSDCGWPSFDRAISKENVELVEDDSHGMHRTEVKCKNCGSHLGHVFNDGPTETGARYCINSISLDFRKKK